MGNVGRETAPAVAGWVGRGGPVECRSEGLTATTALAACGRLRRGGRLFLLSKGAVSAGDVLGWVLARTGASDVLLATWTVGTDGIRALRRLLDSGRIRSLRLLVDPSFASRHPSYCAQVRAAFGVDAIRFAVLHAKICTVVNEAWAVVVRGSANFNENRRLEFF